MVRASVADSVGILHFNCFYKKYATAYVLSGPIKLSITQYNTLLLYTAREPAISPPFLQPKPLILRQSEPAC